MSLLILSFLAMAEEPRVVYKEKTEIDFEALELEGQLQKPHQALIFEKRGALFNPLVTIREEWNNEMLESLNHIQ